MKKHLKQPKLKEPVRIRFKALKDNNLSIYLDTYVEGRRHYEFLKLYIVPETDEASRRQNRETLQLASLMKAQRVIDLANGKYGAQAKKPERLLLTDYMELYSGRLKQTHRGDSYRAMHRNMGNYLRAFLGEGLKKMLMTDIDAGVCRGFASYLKTAQTAQGSVLSGMSSYHYFAAFRSMLAEAVREGIISENPAERLRKQELPRRPMTTKGYLDADEVAQLAGTACRSEAVKRAFMFSCLTGLRLSDIRRLRWENIRRESDSWRFSIIMQKTQEPLQEKLSDEAVGWLPERGGDGGCLFCLPSTSTLTRILREWVAEAGIGKHVTFHCFSHSKIYNPIKINLLGSSQLVTANG